MCLITTSQALELRKFECKQFYKQFNFFIMSSSESEKSEEQTAATSSGGLFFQTPTKYSRSSSHKQEVSNRQVERYRKKELKMMLAKLKDSQMEKMQLYKEEISTRQTRFYILAFFGVIIVGLFLQSAFFQRMNSFEARLSDLQHQKRLMKADIQKLHSIIIQQKETIDQLWLDIEQIRESIVDINMNELLKEEKSIHVFVRYSNRFAFQIDPNISKLKQNFQIMHRRIRKKSQEERMFYSSQSFPSTGTHFIQLKIVQTLYGMISIGVLPSTKKNQECVYCDVSDIYYLYCKNGNIYNGQYFDIKLTSTQVLHRSKSTRIDSVKAGDVVTMFIDNNQKKVYWYVNNRYVASESIEKLNHPIYPFVEMTSRGDQIEILP